MVIGYVRYCMVQCNSCLAVTHTYVNDICSLPNFSDFPTSALVSVCFLHISVTLSGPPVKCWDIPKTDFDRLVSVRVRGLFVNSQDCVGMLVKRSRRKRRKSRDFTKPRLATCKSNSRSTYMFSHLGNFSRVVGLRRTTQNREVVGSSPACVNFLKTLKSVAIGPGFDPRGCEGVWSTSLRL